MEGQWQICSSKLHQHQSAFVSLKIAHYNSVPQYTLLNNLWLLLAALLIFYYSFSELLIQLVFQIYLLNNVESIRYGYALIK